VSTLLPKVGLVAGVALLMLCTPLCARAINEDFNDFVYLTADGIAQAGTLSTLPESPSAFYFNPAALPRTWIPVLMHNHAPRHFPRRQGDPEMDQLDCDMESVIIPLPVGTFGYGFSLQDELGYDYTNHPPGRFDYVLERLSGSETVAAYAVGSYPVRLGMSYHRLLHTYFPPSPRAVFPGGPNEGIPYAGWLRDGESQRLGAVLGLPWLRFATVKDALNLRKLDLPAGKQQVARRKEWRRGWRLLPTGWLSIAGEKRTVVSLPFSPRVSRSAGRRTESRSSSITLRPLGWLEISLGRWNGKRTVGVKLALPGIGLRYAEAKDFLREIVGRAGRVLGDLHFYGVSLGLA